MDAGYLFAVIRDDYPVEVVALFDLENEMFSPPVGRAWVSVEDARGLFLRAMSRAGSDFILENQVRNLMNRFFSSVGSTTTYIFSVQEDVPIICLQNGYISLSGDLLTLITGTTVVTFYRDVEDDNWMGVIP
jgi:hypothetical protein